MAEQVGGFVHLGSCCGTSVCFRVLSVRDRDRQAVHVPELIGEGGDGAAGGETPPRTLLGNRAHRTQVSVRGATGPMRPTRAGAVEAQAGGLPHLPHARELVVPRGTHGRARAVESQRADRVRVPPGGVGRVRASSRAAAAAASKAHVDSSVASAPLSVSNTRTSVPNATAMSVRSGFTAIKGLGACRMCSPPSSHRGRPFRHRRRAFRARRPCACVCSVAASRALG